MDPREKYLAGIAERVARHGHVVQGVFPGAGDDGVPFAYTVGLLGRLGFEAIVVGPMDPDTLGGMLNCLAELDAHPRGVLVSGITAPPYLVTLIDSDSGRARAADVPVSVAERFHGRDDLPLVQVCWPDTHYRMPWHASYDGGRQPVLGDPPTAP